jgi:hypothetical protein
MDLLWLAGKVAERRGGISLPIITAGCRMSSKMLCRKNRVWQVFLATRISCVSFISPHTPHLKRMKRVKRMKCMKCMKCMKFELPANLPHSKNTSGKSLLLAAQIARG